MKPMMPKMAKNERIYDNFIIFVVAKVWSQRVDTYLLRSALLVEVAAADVLLVLDERSMDGTLLSP